MLQLFIIQLLCYHLCTARSQGVENKRTFNSLAIKVVAVTTERYSLPPPLPPGLARGYKYSDLTW